MRVPVLLLAAAVPSLVSSCRPHHAAAVGGCTSYEWTAPETLRGPGNEAMYVESPQLLRRRDTLWVIGSPTWARGQSGLPVLWPSGDSVSPNLVGVKVPVVERRYGLGRGTVISTPPGMWSISTPRAGLDDSGGLHVLWRVAWVPGASADDSRTVWTARWRRGEWSRPHVVLDSLRTVEWLSSRISGVTSVGTTPYIFAPMVLRDTVFVLRVTETGWQQRAAPMDGHIYSEIAGANNDSRTVFVTYVKQNAIHAGEFDIVANKVTQAVRVASFPVGAMIRTRAVLPGADRRAVVWLESSLDDPAVWHLRLAESTDHGANWHAHASLRVRAGSGILQATSDRAGRVHVLFDGPNASPSAPTHAVWDGEGWRQSGLPARSGFVVPSPSITRWGNDSVLAVWAMAESRTSLPVTLWSIGRPCRSRKDSGSR